MIVGREGGSLWDVATETQSFLLNFNGSAAPIYSVAISPDGNRLAASLRLSTDRDLVVLDANRTAEQQRREILPRSTLGHFLVNSWSLDGERLAGQMGAVGEMATGILVYSFKTKTYEKVADFGEWPVWLPDGRRILFVANRNAFYIVDSRTKAVRKIFSAERDVIGPPRLTRDGRTAYFSRRITEADIWLLTLRSER